MSKVKRKKITKKKSTITNYIIRFFYLTISIVLMSFSQSILSYTHIIGMAPIDAITQSMAYMLGLTYPQWNYVIVTILVILAIIFAKETKDKLITSTAFITGYCLAILIGLIIPNIGGLFPGLILDEDGNGQIKKIWIGILWFIVAYISLILSIGMWINVGFGLRPYEALVVKLSQRYEKISFVIFRNGLDTLFLILAIVFSSLSLITNNDSNANWLNRNCVGPGTIFFALFTGYFTKWSKIMFSKLIIQKK